MPHEWSNLYGAVTKRNARMFTKMENSRLKKKAFLVVALRREGVKIVDCIQISTYNMVSLGRKHEMRST